MTMDEWKANYQTEATGEQQAKFTETHKD
jgi:hypothetical protein